MLVKRFPFLRDRKPLHLTIILYLEPNLKYFIFSLKVRTFQIPIFWRFLTPVRLHGEREWPWKWSSSSLDHNQPVVFLLKVFVNIPRRLFITLLKGKHAPAQHCRSRISRVMWRNMQVCKHSTNSPNQRKFDPNQFNAQRLLSNCSLMV